MQRPRPENRLNEPERPKHNKTKVQKREDTSSNKPDKYLRGLKYDSNKNKKREESSRSRGHGRNSNRGLILLCLLIIGGAAALVWYQRKPSTTVTDTVATPAPKVSPAIMCDTTLLAEPPIDTLMESLPMIVAPTTTFKKSINE
jgi:hypothetical protein